MALIKCNECGREISDMAVNCPNCGWIVPKKMMCTECGSQINSELKFCPNCGCPSAENDNLGSFCKC